MKPEFVIDLGTDARSALHAHSSLELLDPACTYHIQRKLRPPLGIYNVSLSRVLHKTLILCRKLEAYFLATAISDSVKSSSSANVEEVIDYIELALYAAADHVDDLKLIVDNFFSSEKERKKSKELHLFCQELKVRKHFISKLANHIKHQQHRVRLFTLWFVQGSNRGSLHGYFIESVEGGVVGPSSIFHETGSIVFSVTSLVWEVICFLLHTSTALNRFLSNQPKLNGPSNVRFVPLQEAIVAASRLPLYTFDDPHPFKRCTLRIVGDESAAPTLRSGIYGSIANRWRPEKEISFGPDQVAYSGDGVTRTFKLVGPSQVGLCHWE